MRNRTTGLILVFFVLSSLALTFSQTFTRIGTVPLPPPQNASFGQMISGMDFDGDGRLEIYAVNNNWGDSGPELIPAIFKFEYNPFTQNWDQVWSAVLNIPLQNTWPALTSGDWDKDGKMEVIWGPVNNLAPGNLNPARVVVFETPGDGSDVMGIPDGGGGYLPNAQWTITATDNFNLRPIRWVLTDIDADGDDELVYISRVNTAGPGNIFGVISVDDIPDNGDGSETWALEVSGDSVTVPTSTAYDIAVMDSALYIIYANGNVTPVTYNAGVWSSDTTYAGLVPGGSWLSASVVDIDNDGTKEIVVAGNGSTERKVYLLQGSPTTLTATEIADMLPLIGTAARLYGGDFGDIDNDGNIDFVFGTRDATPNAAILRLEYQGGDITSSASYTSSLIDAGYASGGRWALINIADVDGDPAKEVLYSEMTDVLAPIVIIDETGSVPVELSSFTANVNGTDVNLNWSTATETNNNGFEVQRKFEEEFVTIGFVRGKGTTTEIQNYSYTDSKLPVGTYSYRLKQVDFDGTFEYSSVINVDLTAPTVFALGQNYPNPFNPTTKISYSVPFDSKVTISVYSITGEMVMELVNDNVSAGSYSVDFDGSNLASGMYIYKMTAGNFTQTNKMMLMK